MASSKSAFTLKVYNNRGKLIESRETARGNQRYAHRVARVVIRDYPSGTRLVLLADAKPVEEFKMHNDGYTFEVLNGDNVQAASRKGEGRKATTSRATKTAATKTAKSAPTMPAQRKGSSTPTTHRKPVRKVRKAATAARAVKTTAVAPF